MTSLDRLVREAVAHFAQKYGRPARWVAAAPGRVNLIGEHTDYNDGFVLPMAIERHAVIAADQSASSEPVVRLVSTAYEGEVVLPLEGAATPDVPPWARYVQGVMAGFQEAGWQLDPFEAVIHADVPLGGGLSSSAALEVATATLLEALTGATLEPLQKARLCQQAEQRYAGVPCGIMDQCASVLGRADELLLLDCRSLQVERVPLADPEVVALIVDSRVKHTLNDGGYAARRQQCETAARLLGVAALRDATLAQLEAERASLDMVLYRRARHVITENERTQAAAVAVGQGDWATLGTLMAASHASLRDDFEVSCPELDVLVELAAALGPAGGVLGSRMTGGGFGGCTISLVRRAQAAAILARIETGYHERTGRTAVGFTTRPASGAHLRHTGTTS